MTDKSVTDDVNSDEDARLRELRLLLAEFG